MERTPQPTQGGEAAPSQRQGIESTESWDERVIREGIDAAVAEGRPIDDRTARYVASQLHGGQSSALYGLASSGNIDPNVYDELDRDRVEQPPAIRRWIAALGVYCATRADQGPVDGWVERAESQDRAELMDRLNAVGTPLGEIATVGTISGVLEEDDADLEDADDASWDDAARWRPSDEVVGEQIEGRLSGTELDELFGQPPIEEIGSLDELGWFGLVTGVGQPGPL